MKKQKLEIKMPPNATAEEIKGYVKDWEFIAKAVAKLTGTEGENLLIVKDKSTGKIKKTRI